MPLVIDANTHEVVDSATGTTIIVDSPMNALMPIERNTDRKPEPPDTVPVVALTKRPYFPGTTYLLPILDAKLVSALYLRKKSGQPYVGMFLVRDVDNPPYPITDATQLHDVGVLGFIDKMAPFQLQFGPNVPGAHVLVSMEKRIRWTQMLSTDPIMVKIDILESGAHDVSQARAYAWEIMDTLKELVRSNANHRNDLEAALNTVDRNKPTAVAELARFSHSDGRALQNVLEAGSMEEQLTRILQLFKSELDTTRMQREIEEKNWKSHRRHFLMEQLKQIRRELGLDQDEKENLLAKFRDRIAKKKVPENAVKVMEDEMAKLSSLDAASSEYNITRTYLDVLTTLPWGTYKKDSFDIERAKKILDKDHYGLKEVKQRILEFIAVGSLRGSVHGKILCFVGPPGVGKTSIGKSIARALGRDFYRFSVGGMGDVAEIKGHRRTYVGAMPGKLLQCLKTTGSSNPVIMIDEIDKLGRGYQGDPASALLEVLDPEQNSSFLDHYLDVPYDLSKVLFICTANVTDTIPGPLLDRMEVQRLSGYVLNEKMAIAKRYLAPTALKNSGLNRNKAQLADSAIRKLIESYCREAGVRNLQQHIDKIMRKCALKIVEGETSKVVVAENNLYEYVGKVAFNTDRLYDRTPTGVVMGLAWTALGGATLYIETIAQAATQSKGELKTTGQMGAVMKESTDIAYTYARTFLDKLDVSNKFFENTSMHMHIPEGATPKDGPSAGITMVTSLLSLAIQKPVLHNLAMTGEITLTGKVLAIGGVKEKTIAAKRSGVTRILFPEANRKDFEELDDYVRAGLTVHYADMYEDVFKIAFSEDTDSSKKRPSSASRGRRRKPEVVPTVIPPSDPLPTPPGGDPRPSISPPPAR